MNARSTGIAICIKRLMDCCPKLFGRLVLLVTVVLMPVSVNGQTRTIAGKVIEEFTFETIPYAVIQTSAGVELGRTDIDGNFRIEIPSGTNELEINFLGLEPTLVVISPNCDFLEIIMLAEFTYDFISLKRADRKRYKRFKRLKDRHLEAYKKGIFKAEEPCVTYKFIEYAVN